MPITQTRTEYQPCADSLYQSLSPGQTYFYPTEYNDVGCVTEVNSGEIIDKRYTHSGLGTNQYELRKDVNVLVTMQHLPDWYSLGPSDIEL